MLDAQDTPEIEIVTNHLGRKVLLHSTWNWYRVDDGQLMASPCLSDTGEPDESNWHQVQAMAFNSLIEMDKIMDTLRCALAESFKIEGTPGHDLNRFIERWYL